jgi:hypothetical protein
MTVDEVVAIWGPPGNYCTGPTTRDENPGEGVFRVGDETNDGSWFSRAWETNSGSVRATFNNQDRLVMANFHRFRPQTGALSRLRWYIEGLAWYIEEKTNPPPRATKSVPDPTTKKEPAKE